MVMDLKETSSTVLHCRVVQMMMAVLGFCFFF